METLPEDWFTSDLVARHAYLEEHLGDGDGGNFLSGWQCVNPWQLTIEHEIAEKRRYIGSSTYLYADQFPEIEKAFIDFHKSVDDCPPEKILFSAGSTQLLLLITAWIRNQKIDEIFYIAPMYHTLHWALKMLGVRSRPINGRHLFEPHFSFNLPDRKTVLIVTDPIWYSGIKIQQNIIDEIAAWQLKTGSLIITDGSFQYMEWQQTTENKTRSFNSSLTIRVVCPTKQLIMHGYRAGYALIPEQFYRDISTLNSMMFGSLSIDTVAFLMAAPNLIGRQAFPRKLMSLAAHRHSQLRANKSIVASWSPDCGYFCFEKFRGEGAKDHILMNGEYFGQPRYPDYYRINLMSPQIATLCSDVDRGFSIELG